MLGWPATEQRVTAAAHGWPPASGSTGAAVGGGAARPPLSSNASGDSRAGGGLDAKGLAYHCAGRRSRNDSRCPAGTALLPPPSSRQLRRCPAASRPAGLHVRLLRPPPPGVSGPELRPRCRGDRHCRVQARGLTAVGRVSSASHLLLRFLFQVGTVGWVCVQRAGLSLLAARSRWCLLRAWG